jgi:serine-type D-Ala-D-Ala carboxypeptidase (penicillin-binding protein 5/6)
MKRIVLFVFVCLLIAQTAWAGRAKVNSISRDPYISALLLDGDTGKTLLADNADAMVYPASVLKLMNLLVILERIEQGTLRLDEMVQVTREAAKTGGSQVYLDPKEQFSVEDLLYALMVQSANDAAVALATHIAGSKEGFVALMNQKAEALGMKNTHFYSVHGLPPSDGQKPDQTTARDLSILCRELARRPDALQYTGTKERGFRENTFIMRNHNHLLGEVDGCDGFKTGFFDAAGFSIAATAKKGGVRIIAIVMGSKDRKVRDAKAKELLAKGFILIPPKPGVAVVRPEAAPQKIQAEVPAEIQTTAPPAKKKETEASFMNGWGKFFLGIGVGLLLFGILAILKSRKRSRDNTRFGRYS